MNTYGIGTKAYIDGFGGLIPCIVQKISDSGRFLTVKVTLRKARNGYRNGEVLGVSALFTPPRDCVYCRNRKYRIKPFQYRS